jgi:hypothetical protein
MDFRHYDPYLGRFNVIDPMAEERNWLTPYNFVQNNPILRVDPSGLLDDYFDKEGNFLGSDELKTDNVKIIDKKDWDANKTVSDNGVESIDSKAGDKNSVLHSKSGISDEASLKIYENYNPTDLNMEVDNDFSGNAGFTRTTVRKGDEVVEVKTKLKVNVKINNREKISDHANEIKNILVHEAQHYEDFKVLGNKIYSNLSTTQKEKSAYSSQMKHSTFKKTRKGFQKATRRSAQRIGGIISAGLKPVGIKPLQ